MKQPRESNNERHEYARFIEQVVQAMAEGRPEAIPGVSSLQGAKLFIDGVVEKRREKLALQFKRVAEAFPTFDRHLDAYVQQQPAPASLDTMADARRFLNWLQSRIAVTPEQRDYLHWQRCVHAVQNATRKKRMAYVRFRELSSLAKEWPDSSIDRLSLHLNPTAVLLRFKTTAMLEGGEPPVDAVVFAANDDIRTVVFEDGGGRLFRELILRSPSVLAKWDGSDYGDFAEFAQTLAQLDLLVFG